MSVIYLLEKNSRFSCSLYLYYSIIIHSFIPYIRVGMYGSEVDLLDEMVADKISPDLVTWIELLLFRHCVAIESLHAYFQQVFVID